MNKDKSFDRNLLREFEDKKILVTGGTGSIGSSLVKQLIKYKPNNVRILSNDENSIFELRRTLLQKNLTYMVGDIRDADRIKLAIRGIDIVFHAAAMKHIDICEQNPFDAVKTNVIGTSNMLEASILEDVEKFIFISTDKATHPSSTLGASKLLGERLTLDASSYRGLGRTAFSIVRFGNVLGSRGSVFQIFLDMIKSGKPLTVTDPRMTRFIMSISEATSLILKVAKIAKDGEIFILKMPSVKIVDLARAMIQVYKTRFPLPKEPSIRFTSVREREKLHEFLITHEETHHCHDLGDMYKISKEVTDMEISHSKFSSENMPRISKEQLHMAIGEILDNY